MADILETVRADGENLAITDCWRALDKAKEIGWLDFTSPAVDFDNCIDMREYLHYDSPANGGVHVVVPSKLIVFRCPSDDPTNECDVPLRRTPAYYAEVLADFGVRLVLRCGGAPYDKAPLLAAGIDVDDLPILDPAPPPALALAARCLLMLANACPGALALHYGEGPDGRSRAVERLVASYLVSRHGFDPAAAVAWDRMVRPAAAASAAASVVYSIASAADAGPAAPVAPADGASSAPSPAGQAMDALQLEPLVRRRWRGGRSAPAEPAPPRRSRSLAAPRRARPAARSRTSDGRAASGGFQLA
jgi:hypothetical protein